MSIAELKPGTLAFVIVAYFLGLVSLLLLAVMLFPGLEGYLPMAGLDAREVAGIGESDIVVESTLSVEHVPLVDTRSG